MSDFERGLINAIKIEFLRATVSGCEFHFQRDNHKKWRSCGLSRAPKTALFKAWTLPLVPPDRRKEAVAIIQRDLDTINLISAQRYGHYLRN